MRIKCGTLQLNVSVAHPEDVVEIDETVNACSTVADSQDDVDFGVLRAIFDAVTGDANDDHAADSTVTAG